MINFLIGQSAGFAQLFMNRVHERFLNGDIHFGLTFAAQVLLIRARYTLNSSQTRNGLEKRLDFLLGFFISHGTLGG